MRKSIFEQHVYQLVSKVLTKNIRYFYSLFREATGLASAIFIPWMNSFNLPPHLGHAAFSVFSCSPVLEVGRQIRVF